MGFLAPLFLLGGLLVALPVILHLTRRRREPIPFPSFLLLRMTSATARWKRRRFRNIPLLVLRCLALLLLALAFAEPLLESEVAEGGSGAPLDLAVLLDRSLSMSVPGRLEEAQRLAGEELARLGRDDRAVVVAFAERAEALGELGNDPEALGRSLAEITASDEGTRIAPALRLAAGLLPQTTGRRREVVLISDLQASGFEEGRPRPSLPPGVELSVRSVGPAPPANAWVREVRVSAEGRDQLVATAEVRYAPLASAPERTIEAALLLSGREVDRRPVELAADRTASLRFAAVPRPSEPVPAEVRLEADGFPGDDGFRFVIHPETAIRVTDLGGGSANAVYVREALGVGLEPAFLLDRGPARGESAVARALAGSQAALVREPGALDSGAAQALADFVEAGGGLVMAVGPRRTSGQAAAVLSELLPALPGELVDRDPAGRFADYALRHPVFEPFTGSGAGALTGPSFYRYRRLNDPAADADILARFDDGQPAILAANHGAGRVLLFASSLDADWNDLPRRAVFVPFLQRLVEVAAGYEEIPLAYRVGESVDPAAAFRLGEAADEDSELLVEAPSGARSVLEGASAIRLAEAGFFRARRPGTADTRDIAVNPPLAESDLRILDDEEVRIGAAAPPAPSEAEGDATDTATNTVPTTGYPVWRLLLAGLLLLLLAEGWAAASHRRRASAASSYTGGESSPAPLTP